MSDPAVEAARRAMAYPNLRFEEEGMVDAAREALLPLRELHQVESRTFSKFSGEIVRTDHLCGQCDMAWPCATARLIYSDEELTDG